MHNPHNPHNSKKSIDLQRVIAVILCKSPCTNRAQLRTGFNCVRTGCTTLHRIEQRKPLQNSVLSHFVRVVRVVQLT